MLVLTRKINETIVIGGNIRVTMTGIRNRQVRLAIDAPLDVSILREELVPDPPEIEIRLDRDRPTAVFRRPRQDRARGASGLRKPVRRGEP